MITIYALNYNESLLMQFMIDHYRSRFPGCHIVIYDNSSTDNSVEIAKANGCEIRNYNSGGTLDDGLHMRIKNSCWKDAKTDWVLVIDLDELLDINEARLKQEESLGVTRIRTDAWSMVNLVDNYDIPSMKHGFSDGGYSKYLLFNKKYIKEINYSVGAHSCSPTGTVKDSEKAYIIRHYKYINVELDIAKRKLTSQRLSQANRSHKWGVQCFKPEHELRTEFQYYKGIATQVIKDPIKLTVFTVTYNEELILPLMIEHYRSRFPGCHIVVYDNQSTDKTVEIAKANGCEIRHYDSGGQVNDQMLWDTKNTCWKTAKTDWIAVVDTDEMLDINAEQLTHEESIGTTKIKCECWHMVNMKDNLDVHNINYGCRNPKDTVYDKDLMFNKKYVEINYINNDCHFTNSRGTIKNSKPYKMWHYKYVNPDIFVNKQKTSAQRLSEINKKNGWGAQCTRDEGSLRNEFQQARNAAVKVFSRGDEMKHFYEHIQGWFDYQDLYSKVVNEAPHNAHFVEVGAWKGCSSAYLGVEIVNSGKNIKLDVVDTWSGDHDDPTSYHTDTEFMSYNRNILELFKKNVKSLLHIINPIQMESTAAAKLYEDNTLDFVFLDANHKYDAVKDDITYWLPKLKKGTSYLAGHDYNPASFPGVVQAVHEVFSKEQIKFIGGSWIVKV